jgi:CheY-like chemotaxis protein
MQNNIYKRSVDDCEERKPLILVVEDDEDNLLVISHTLIFFEHNFITASEIKTALELATNHQIDLILVDIVLGKTNGLQLIRKLKQQQSTRNIPIIALTALSRNRERESILEAGCDDYLCKPYLIDDLDKKIRDFLLPKLCQCAFLNSA